MCDYPYCSKPSGEVHIDVNDKRYEVCRMHIEWAIDKCLKARAKKEAKEKGDEK